MRRSIVCRGLLLVAVAGLACGSRSPATPPGPADAGPMTIGDPGVPVDVTPPAAVVQAAAAECAARWPARFQGDLGYDPLAAQGLDRIAASNLGVSEAERAILGRDGF